MTIKKIIEYLDSNQPLAVATHRDADGCYSTALIAEVYKINAIDIPDKFQDYCYFPSEKEGNRPINLALDLGQSLYKEFKGVVIDHHDHPNPWYMLLWDIVPTSLIVYNTFKDKIPDIHKWKVAGGLVGDGQSELIPSEIWDLFPVLLEERTYLYASYGKVKEYPQIVYQMLSSPVNAMCRLGNAVDAIKIIKRAKHPDDILENPVMKNDVLTIRKEEQRILTEYNILKTVKNVVSIMEIESNAWISSRIASKIQANNPRKTIVVVNPRKSEISIRGTLASYLGEKLRQAGFLCGGHPGFWGGSIEETQTVRDLVETIRSIIP